MRKRSSQKLKAKTSTSLTLVRKAGMELTKTFINQATRELLKLRELREKAHKSWTDFIVEVQLFRSKHYHLAIENPATPGVPYTRYDEWASNEFGKSTSTIKRDMGLYTQLEGTVDRPDLDTMPKENAEILVDIKRRGKKISPAIIDAAKTLPTKKFEQVAYPKGKPGLTTDSSDPEVLRPARLPLLPMDVYDLVDRGLTMACEFAKDGDMDTPLKVKAVGLIFGEFVNAHEVEYNEIIKDREMREAVEAAERDGENEATAV